ncbi:uncharacterized protein LOC127856354 [Dreissena polymorpha]|uniref:Uncharacterized protein n=1 Tax=Dreissena polymorpha TaxID=45954 RepID=A0A9D4HIC0_DREPO|nr:uncharacterized protein LOC127856354 [Dreissena polymorpha]KAH3719792.1 hypothetical protein DPMN_062666 [Dreissena polymorpha]
MSLWGNYLLLVSLLWMSNRTCSQEFDQIHWKIQRERATEIIKNQILRALARNDAVKVPQGDFEDLTETESFQQSVNLIATGSIDTEQKHTLQPARVKQSELHEHHVQTENEPPQEALIILGEETTSSKKSKCLVFNFKKANNTKPFRMPLYMYIRKVRDTGHDVKQARGARDAQIADTASGRNDNSGKKKKNQKRKNKRTRGRKIHVTISDGDSNINLVKTQRRIQKTGWYQFDLPISHFPSVFSAHDSYTLCFRCKRCSKKIKLEIERKRKRPGERASGRTFIPFIHVDYRSPLPQSSYRQKRSSHGNSASHILHTNRHDRHMTSTRHDSSMTSSQKDLRPQYIPNCCVQSTFLQNITADISRVLYPESVNVTMCATSTTNILLRHDTADVTSLITPYNKLSCEPYLFKDFNYVYLDRHMKLKQGVIKHLIPQSCHCLVTA